MNMDSNIIKRLDAILDQTCICLYKVFKNTPLSYMHVIVMTFNSLLITDDLLFFYYSGVYYSPAIVYGV